MVPSECTVKEDDERVIKKVGICSHFNYILAG